MEEAFTPITTQEQLERIVGERLEQDREARAKSYEGWISPEDLRTKTKGLQTQIDTLSRENQGFRDAIAQKDASLKRYEAASLKSRIADEVGLDRRLIDRLNGETEEDIRKDAQSLKALFGAARTPFPLGEPEPVQKHQSKAALKTMLATLKGDN